MATHLTFFNVAHMSKTILNKKGLHFNEGSGRQSFLRIQSMDEACIIRPKQTDSISCLR